MHMHCSRSASRVAWLLSLTPRSRARPGSGSFRSSVRCKGGQRSRSRHSCPWTWGPGAWCTRWLEGGGGPGPQRRTRRNFAWNSETAGRSHSLSCWAPGGQAVLKPAREKMSLWVSRSLPNPPLPTPLYRPPIPPLPAQEGLEPAPGFLHTAPLAAFFPCNFVILISYLWGAGLAIWC